jgi:hypothetical protein
MTEANKGEQLRLALVKYPEQKKVLAELRKQFGSGLKLEWIKFKDGTEIGHE